MAEGQSGSSYEFTSLPAPNPPPIHVHVDTHTPVHVHIRKTSKNLDPLANPIEEVADHSARNSSLHGPWIPNTKLSKVSHSKDDDRNPPILAKSPRLTLTTDLYQPDPELDKESQAFIKSYIEKCAQERRFDYGRRKSGFNGFNPPPKSPQSDSKEIACQNEFLNRVLKVLKKEKLICGRTAAGQDHQYTLEQLEAEIEELSGKCNDLHKCAKGIIESHESQDSIRKRDILINKVSEMESPYKVIRKALGVEESSNNEVAMQMEEVEHKNNELACELHEQEATVDALHRQLKCEKDYNQSLCRLQTELEETRCSLQREMLNKSAEIERTAIQMKNLQNQMGERISEVENLQCYMEQTGTRNECEKEALKRALKLQVEKAVRCEEGLQKALIKVNSMEEQVNKTKLDIKHMEAEVEKLRPEASSKRELEEICHKLQEHLKELHPLPELLKTTEMKLKEEQIKNMHNETRISEQSRLITEISSKIDGHQQNIRKLTEELNNSNSEKNELAVKLRNMTSLHEQGQGKIAELNSQLQARNEVINTLNCKLEDKDCNNLEINRQLEEALNESNRLSRMVEERAIQLEKQNLGRMKDLENQLACTKQEIKQLKAEKKEIECQYTRQMQDLREKLEQCDAASHSLNSYISYLKTAYASVFNNPNLTLICPPSKEAAATS